MRQHEQAHLLLKKAEEDIALLAEVLASEKISDEIFGFHAQQAAEKCLKAMLSEFDVRFPRTHNLRLLMGDSDRWKNFAECMVDYSLVRFRR